ncbi:MULTISPECIES: hypothetical protein [Streptomyces]|uniref:Uncharacterized protein n=1 Tax=Streptomyces tsukubensis (strain DSM 42081 / NBRC 108919 / NRRL 18488 / 9993) TaxID=1114943 RepID=I2MXM9_STRT9|nr:MULTISPECIES: hypothetical protein [Streptomyces]AZK93901.1 hypothetical protein B7R87_08435 [Streptomyces tsukubensis]EIF89526.1 hypothetical protein [Streptomyces tsukubensis NRRL18488]MYS64241.1 hypothetical protein [Streptomyces sp. SID5473]QKM69972.1 hypothetical protein STSU_025380 [Streptomyces tsukubensis NRRL18488]TAI46051.1 hypothetical protein EWI31_02785 [Streptomyces tsukubensis]
MRTVTAWAEKTFGDAASQLTHLIPASLVRAHDRARSGHEGVQTQTLEAYGHGLYAAQYEELEVSLAPLSAAAPVRLQGRTLMLLGDQLIYPLRYAKRDVPVTAARLRRATGLRADLIRRHGPEPMQQAFDLGFEEPDELDPHPDLALLSKNVKLVLVAYACSMVQGVMRIEWGSAELRQEDRHLIWHHHEPLPLIT